ncbi:hypothetical protein HAX54_022523 [Datura stramonium]|uniref:Uncharacterized protein n=1 Tax=Datura stramonium TaxID=4076 RepID=A0ABS8UUP9_DATST|nr:hypothetical protein [Datura stramonium]
MVIGPNLGSLESAASLASRLDYESSLDLGLTIESRIWISLISGLDLESRVSVRGPVQDQPRGLASSVARVRVDLASLATGLDRLMLGSGLISGFGLESRVSGRSRFGINLMYRVGIDSRSRGRGRDELASRVSGLVSCPELGLLTRTDLKRGNITSDEEAIIIKLRATGVTGLIPSDEKELPQAVVELAKKATQQQIIKQRRKVKQMPAVPNSTSETTVVLSTVPSIMSNKEKEIISTIANDENNAMEFDHNKDQMLWHDDIMLMNDKNEELDQDFIFDCLWDIAKEKILKYRSNPAM